MVPEASGKFELFANFFSLLQRGCVLLSDFGPAPPPTRITAKSLKKYAIFNKDQKKIESKLLKKHCVSRVHNKCYN